MTEIRKKKIESLIREKISEMILKEEIKDPRIHGLITVTEVEIARDLKDANVYLSVMAGLDDRRRAVETFQHAAGHVQKLLGRRISLKSTPRLHFRLDDSLERGYRLSQTLKGLGS
jgi:ribosome-binding factor A